MGDDENRKKSYREVLDKLPRDNLTAIMLDLYIETGQPNQKLDDLINEWILNTFKEKAKPKLILEKSYRKASEYPRPDLPRFAEANRQTERVSLRLPPDLLAKIDEVAEAAGMNRTEWFKIAAIRQLSASEPELTAENQSDKSLPDPDLAKK